MNKFMGIENVKNVEPILGADGVADGFRITYTSQRRDRWGMLIDVEMQQVKWVREPVVKNDGFIHGFGNGTVYKRASSKKRAKKAEKKPTVNLAYITKLLKK